MKNKKIIIICMLVAILIMVVIYAAFQTQLKINGTSKITSTWQIEITNITSTATGLASNITEPSYSGTNASFNARLRKPGDKMEYAITVKNNGSVNAIIDEVKAEVTGSYVIVYSIEGLQEKVRLASGASKTFKVIVEFDVNATSIPSETSKEIDIGIMCIQDTGQTLTPTTPDIEGENPNLLARKILLNNPAQSDASIDFSKPSSSISSYSENHATTTSSVSFSSSSTYYYGTSYTFDSATGYYALAGTKTSGTWSTMSSNYSTYPYTCQGTSSTETCTTLYKMTGYTSTTAGTGYKYTRSANYKSDNGQGVYYTNVNTEEGKTTYYFRGNVTNNYVSFAGLTWRIVRINEDGSIRLITQDNVGTSRFNSINDDNAYVGYMYGTVGSSTYALTHANTNNSTIKTYLDTWYQSNLSSYSNYLADAGFCNDRSKANTSGSWYDLDTALGYGTNHTYYGSYNRLHNLNKPQYACPQSNDLFTTSSSSKGNKSLTNPIGLITADEVTYAGGIQGNPNSNYYLVNGSMFGTMSPYCAASGPLSIVWNVFLDGTINGSPVNVEPDIRPVINLKSTVEVSSGDGTSAKPYIVKIQ